MLPEDPIATDGSADRIAEKVDLLREQAGSLRMQANRFVMLLLAHQTGVNGDVATIPAVRRALYDYRVSLRMVLNSDKDLLAGAEESVLKMLTACFSRDALRVLDHFGEIAGNAAKKLRVKGQLPQEILSELVRLVVWDLDPVLSDIEAAMRTIARFTIADAHDLAATDELTKLPNRRALHELMRNFDLGSSDDRMVTIMHLDLDKFKIINDTVGHAAGDEALRHASSVLQRAVRTEDFVARVGGDEFVIVYFGKMSGETLSLRAEQIIEQMSRPFLFEGKEFAIGCSIGIAGNDCDPGVPLDRLLNNADLALYSAKNAGRGRHNFFDDSMRSQFEQIEELTEQIKIGIEENQFVPYFQPQVEGRTGKLVGFEALVRWNHPQRGTLTPFHFLEAAENAQLLDRLDEAISQEVLSVYGGWIRSGFDVPQVSLNITSSRLLEPTLVDQLTFAVDRAELSPEMIGIEILESAMIEANSKTMIDNIQRLGAAGFKVELDDFGTGHASISNLRNFKVDRIKIDRTFVKDIHLYTELSKITSAMIGLAHSLRVDALAEGVETPEERLVLNALGCDHIQGFGVSEPMPVETVTDWIKRTQRPRVLPKRRRKTAG